jgi:D-alanyl-D-alanine carboxypeptidase (penicillin-binding protein 5/6)
VHRPGRGRGAAAAAPPVALLVVLLFAGAATAGSLAVARLAARPPGIAVAAPSPVLTTATSPVAAGPDGEAAPINAPILSPTPSTGPSGLPDRFPGVAAAYLVRRDGIDLWGASVDVPLPPASLAKLMTALLVVEAGRADDVVTVSARAAGTGGARVGLRTGERLAVSALLAALLLRSANDACIALAEWRDGSEKAFVARMNARAAALGLAGTHFAGACGFDAGGQRSSARDLAALAERVLRQPALAALAARERMIIRSEGDRVFTLVNTNALLGRIPGVDGLKTGFTNGAGRCLVVSAERGGVRVLAVLLGAGDRWWDAVAMVEQAFDAPAPRDGRGR